jgi:hypothetical protein
MNTKDAIAEARARIKKIAASMLVRKESLESEQRRLDDDRARVERELEACGDDAARKSAIEQMRGELRERLAAKNDELAVAEKDYRDALAQIEELGRLARTAERAELRAVVDSARAPDLDERSAEDIALANVREHIENLEARADLERELSGDSSSRTARVRDRAAERARSEADARSELEALKAKRRDRTAGDPESGSDDEAPKGGNVGPKRTL